jgi:hypothetical protein
MNYSLISTENRKIIPQDKYTLHVAQINGEKTMLIQYSNFTKTPWIRT